MQLGAAWVQEARSALIAQAKALAGGVERVHVSVTEVARPGSEELDRLEIRISLRPPSE